MGDSREVPICSNHEIYFGGKSGQCRLCELEKEHGAKEWLEVAERIRKLEKQLKAVEEVGLHTHPSWNCSDEFNRGWKACREQVETLLEGNSDE